MSNRFDRLVDDLVNGHLTLTQIQIAIRASIRQRTDIPEPVKDLLAGSGEGSAGLIYQIFQSIQQIIGNVELAYRRGVQAGKESKR